MNATNITGEVLIVPMREEQSEHTINMNIENVSILMIILIFGPIILIKWKKRHFKSFQLVTSLALWLLPFVMSILLSFWTFIMFWTLFSLITGLILRKALEKPLHESTPRLVYKWFYFIYKLTLVFGIVGHFTLIAIIFGICAVLKVHPSIWINYGLLSIFYGFYFGILGQDVAKICTSKMAAHLGHYSPQGMPTRSLDKNICALCGNNLLLNAGEKGIIESTFQLTCGHKFHESCIRGWCIVGKQQTCPYCKERVYLRQMFHLWEKCHVVFGELLDRLRWFAAWGLIMMWAIIYFKVIINGLKYIIYNEIFV